MCLKHIKEKMSIIKQSRQLLVLVLFHFLEISVSQSGDVDIGMVEDPSSLFLCQLMIVIYNARYTVDLRTHVQHACTHAHIDIHDHLLSKFLCT